MEKPITVLASGLKIEGLMEKRPGTVGAVITHPHPLYGGDMHNLVVETVRLAYSESGFSTLRFNFRGVGKSQGSYGQGEKEQTDVRFAVSFLKEAGIDTVHLCGYSFGAWVNAKAVMQGLLVDAMVMVSPPAAFMDFEGISGLRALKSVIVGDRDEMAPLRRIREMLPLWNPTADLEILPGADHFFSGHVKALKTALLHQL